MPVEPRESPQAPLVEVRGIGVSFAGRTVLSDVDLSVRPGEIVTLIGPNGAGKTTLVRVLLGLQRPERGRVLRREGLSLAYVPQRFAIDPTLPLTVARFLALPRPRRRCDVDAALAEVGVGHLAKSALHRLSGGEFQRVMLARAILRAPDLLVLDEPLQGVDFTGQIALFELVARLRREHGYAVLMVSHDLHLVMRATDRVICLNHHVCCHGEPEEVSRHPAYTELFGPAAARALAVYSHAHDHRHDLAGEVVAADAGEPAEGGREGAA